VFRPEKGPSASVPIGNPAPPFTPPYLQIAREAASALSKGCASVERQLARMVVRSPKLAELPITPAVFSVNDLYD
jgi:hypothetical protein